MTNKKDNKALLSEEIKRHMNLVEYTFYVGEDEDVVGNPDDLDNKDLLLGEEPEDEEMDMPDAEAGDEPFEEPSDTEEPLDVEEPATGDVPAEEPLDVEEPATGDVPAEEPLDVEEPAEDEVELDVTQLVQGTEEAKMSADMANQKMVELIQHFNELSAKINQLEDLNGKIEALEDEIVKRNPTPVEKLEMRSLESFPYNLKLTDYWEDKESEGDIEATSDVDDVESEPEEYVLTNKDVNAEFNQQQMPNSFDIDDEDEDELDAFEYLK